MIKVTRRFRKIEASNREAPGATFNLDRLEEKPRESKSGKGSHELKREKKGKDKKRGRKHNKRSRK